MSAQRDTHLVPSVLTAGLGGFLVLKGLSMPHPRGWSSSPGWCPIIIGGVLVLLALLLLAERRRLRARPAEAKTFPQAPINVKIIGAVCGSLALYILVNASKKLILWGLDYRQEVDKQHNIGVACLEFCLTLGIALIVNGILEFLS